MATLKKIIKAAAPEVIVTPHPSDAGAPRHIVRAEITFADGRVKVFTGASQDALLDLSKIEVNG